MTSEDVIRLDQRVIALEGQALQLQARVSALEANLAAANSKVETLNTFYGGALSESTARLMDILDKVTGGTIPTA